MKIHCVRSKQTRNGRYEYQADGVVEIQGYYYPIKAGSIVSPDTNSLEIQTYKGEHYVLQYIPKRSEWTVNTDNVSVIISVCFILSQSYEKLINRRVSDQNMI